MKAFHDLKAFHDSRDSAFRLPLGALNLGEAVTLSIDVWNAPHATVMLRTWIDGRGEERIEMPPTTKRDAVSASQPVRYQLTLEPGTAGAIWYQFVIREPDGREWRYGTQDRKTGGEGRLVDWEPPSFLLAVRNQDGSLPPLLDTWEKHALEDAVVRFLRGEASAYDLDETITALHENFPGKDWEELFDLLGTPDRQRLFARLGGMTEEEIKRASSTGDWNLNEIRASLAKGRLWCASLIQALAFGSRKRSGEPGANQSAGAAGEDGAAGQAVATNEAGAAGQAGAAGKAGATGQTSAESTASAAANASVASEAGAAGRANAAGGADELASRWGLVDKDCGDIVRNAFDLHRTLPLFSEGRPRWFAVNDDVLGFWRTGDGGESACVLINASLGNAYDIPVPLANEAVSDVLDGYDVRLVDESEIDGQPAFGSTAPACDPDQRRATSAAGYALPHLHQLGTSVLYFHPRERLQREMQPGAGVLAHITSLPTGNPRKKGACQLPGTLGEPARRFIDWLAQAGVRYWQVLPVNPTDEYGSPYAGISAFAGNAHLLEGGFSPESDANALEELADSDGYRTFCSREADWLEPYACFMAIRQEMGPRTAWQDWPDEYRRYDPQLAASDPKLSAHAETWRRAQFAFELQWSSMRAYANERGVQVVGDMPIYVSADSADVWANPHVFQLGGSGKPDAVAGCPPDAFAAEGQVWGNPLYDWDALQANSYEWWMRRLERAFHLYDWVRLDHFIGFARYFSIPAGEKATAGTYYPGPGLAFFRKAHGRFGQLPIIAEDLGSITPAIRALGSACGFPGMDIVQFVDGNDPLSGYWPRPEKIAYTGTHDNQTLVGYCELRYPQLDAREAAKSLIEKVAACSAPVCVFPLQDVLLLGDEARMNVPGTAEGNWTWQADGTDVERAAGTMREIVAMRRDWAEPR